MEAMGRDGDRGAWSYSEQTGSSPYTIISSSGTTSTGYASSGSRLSPISTEAAMHLGYLELDEEKRRRMSSSQQIKKIKSLVQEFFGAPPANCSIEGADVSVLERWFTELGVGWVFHLHLAGGASSAGKLEHTSDVWSWCRAFAEIMDTFPSSGSVDDEGPATESEKQDMTDQFQFALFIQQAMLKMLDFVDVIVAPSIITCQVFLSALYHKLRTLLPVHQALSVVLSMNCFWLSFDSSPNAEVERIHGEIVSVLSAKEGKAGEAIWSIVEGIRTGILESIKDSQDLSGTKTPQGSSDIHKATRSLMNYVNFLQRYCLLVDPIVSEAARLGKYVPQIGDMEPLTSLISEMVSCLQEKLANKSEKFPDQSLRFLFLLNNSSFMEDQLRYNYYFPTSYKAALTDKAEGYMESYIHASWAPVLSCLFNPTPLCLFGKNYYSPLPKFESEFQKTYTTQKMWKVPDPYLRNTLRKAIRMKIIPGYTKYIEDNNVTTPKFTPRNLEEMLQELFER